MLKAISLSPACLPGGRRPWGSAGFRLAPQGPTQRSAKVQGGSNLNVLFHCNAPQASCSWQQQGLYNSFQEIIVACPSSLRRLHTCMFHYFLSALLRYNQYIVLYKFKLHNVVIHFTTVLWKIATIRLVNTSIISHNYPFPVCGDIF